jgi:hypothetical protein
MTARPVRGERRVNGIRPLVVALFKRESGPTRSRVVTPHARVRAARLCRQSQLK